MIHFEGQFMVSVAERVHRIEVYDPCANVYVLSQVPMFPRSNIPRVRVPIPMHVHWYWNSTIDLAGVFTIAAVVCGCVVFRNIHTKLTENTELSWNINDQWP